jgi:hypothetical protein
VIVPLRLFGALFLILAAGISLIDVQLSRYEHELVLRSFRDLFVLFDIRATEPWDFGLLPDALLWKLFWDPLLSVPASIFFGMIGLLLLASGRKVPQLTKRNLFDPTAE